MAGVELGSQEGWREKSRSELEGRRWHTGRLRLPVFIEFPRRGEDAGETQEFTQVMLFVAGCAVVARAPDFPTCTQVCWQPPPSPRPGHPISDTISADWSWWEHKWIGAVNSWWVRGTRQRSAGITMRGEQDQYHKVSGLSQPLAEMQLHAIGLSCGHDAPITLLPLSGPVTMRGCRLGKDPCSHLHLWREPCPQNLSDKFSKHHVQWSLFCCRLSPLLMDGQEHWGWELPGAWRSRHFDHLLFLTNPPDRSGVSNVTRALQRSFSNLSSLACLIAL